MSPMPRQQPLDADARLGPGQRATGAGVRPPAEGEVLLGVRAVHAELVRVVEAARVAARGAVQHHDAGAGRDVDSAHRRRRCGRAGSRPSPGSRSGGTPRRSRRCAAGLPAGAPGCRAVADGLQRGRRAAGPSSPARPRTRWPPPGPRRCTSGSDPSGKVAVARPVRTSSRGSRRRSSTYVDEAVVEELQRRVAHRCVTRCCRGPGHGCGRPPGAPRGTTRGPLRGRPRRSAIT